MEEETPEIVCDAFDDHNLNVSTSVAPNATVDTAAAQHTTMAGKQDDDASDSPRPTAQAVTSSAKQQQQRCGGSDCPTDTTSSILADTPLHTSAQVFGGTAGAPYRPQPSPLSFSVAPAQPVVIRVSHSDAQTIQYRMQLNTLAMQLRDLPQHLHRATQLVIATYVRDRQSALVDSSGSDGHHSATAAAVAGTSGATPPPIPFEDVPLVEVTFNHNHLTDDAMPCLVAFLSSNKHIRSFEMLGNNLTDGCAPQLRRLLQACPHLQRIKLADNQLSDAAAAAIGETIFEASVLASVTNEPSEAVDAASPTTASSPTTTTTTAATAGAAAFPMPSKPRFLQLNIGGNRIGTRGIKALCEAALVSGMQILGLRGVALTPEGWGYCGALCAAYAHPVPQQEPQQQPTCNYNGDGDDGGGDARPRRGSGGRHVGGQRHALTCHTITELQLKLNPMTSSACMESFVRSAQAAASLQTTHAAARVQSTATPTATASPLVYSTVTSLTLACCAIDAGMCARLVSLLQTTLTTLEHLDLGHNNIGDEGCSAIAGWLQPPTSDGSGPGGSSRLISLSLEFTGLSVHGLKSLSNAFVAPAQSSSSNSVRPYRRRLQVLNIGANVFGTVATPLLVQLLSSTPALEKLYVRGCHFGGPSHLVALIDALLQLPTISDVDFTSNFSGDDGAHWDRLIGLSATIRRLMLTDNSMSVAATTAIANALVRTPHRQLVVLQLGGKSKVEPLGNVVAAPAHAAVLRAIQRNRQGACAATTAATGHPSEPSLHDGGVAPVALSSASSHANSNAASNVLAQVAPHARPQGARNTSTTASYTATRQHAGGPRSARGQLDTPEHHVVVSMPLSAANRRRSSDSSSGLLNYSVGGNTPTAGFDASTNSWPSMSLATNAHHHHHVHHSQSMSEAQWNNAMQSSLSNTGPLPSSIAFPTLSGCAPFANASPSSDPSTTPLSVHPSASSSSTFQSGHQRQPSIMSIASGASYYHHHHHHHHHQRYDPHLSGPALVANHPPPPLHYPSSSSSTWGGGSMQSAINTQGSPTNVVVHHSSAPTPPHNTTAAFLFAGGASPSPNFHSAVSGSAPSSTHHHVVHHQHHQHPTTHAYHPQPLLAHQHPPPLPNTDSGPPQAASGGFVYFAAPYHQHSTSPPLSQYR